MVPELIPDLRHGFIIKFPEDKKTLCNEQCSTTSSSAIPIKMSRKSSQQNSPSNCSISLCKTANEKIPQKINHYDFSNHLTVQHADFAGDTKDLNNEELSSSSCKIQATARTKQGNNSDEYDTDCEVEDLFAKKKKKLRKCADTDFGHLTYQRACSSVNATPCQKIIKLLKTGRLQMNFSGLNENESKALTRALKVNCRLNELSLESNGMSDASVSCIASCFQKNVFITKLNLGGNFVKENGSGMLGRILKCNKTVTHLNISDCEIGDDEISLIAEGLQGNTTLLHLNVSTNKIGIKGGCHFGKSLGLNVGLEYLNLSWNMLRGNGAIAICKSLNVNKTVREINLSWNGFGFHGCLALSEALKVNYTLRKLNVSNNRIDGNCAKYLSRALARNINLEVLEIGQNPISMEGTLKILDAIDKPNSVLRRLCLADIPINNKIAFKAMEISNKREFAMNHGGVICTRDIPGMKKIKREDPLTLLIRYLSTMGIRVVDLFRMFDTTSKLYVSTNNFIKGLKRVRVPLDDEDMFRVARRFHRNKQGDISYQALASNVRNHIREGQNEHRRLKVLESKKREERRRILENELPLYAQSSFLPALHNMFGSRITKHSDHSDHLYSRSSSNQSRQSSDKTNTLLPVVDVSKYRDVINNRLDTLIQRHTERQVKYI